MSTHLFLKIDAMYPQMSKGQKRIANYVKQHYEKAAFMTAAVLGDTVGVSESTVVRFAAEMGYDGYPDLQKHLRDLVKNRLTSVQRMEVAKTRYGDADMLNAAFAADIEMIRTTRDQISREAFQASVNALSRAKRIYIIGVRSSAALAKFAAFYFNLVHDRVHLVDASSTSEVFEQIYRITRDDVCLAISFPRYSKQTVLALQFIRERGADVVAVTDSENSPLAEHATYLLTARSNMVSFVDSLTAPLSLLNALIAAVAQHKQEEVAENLQTLENIWQTYQVYQTQEDEM